MAIVFANNAQSSLAAPISNTATSIQVQAGQGSLFPNPNPGDVFYVTMTDVLTQTNTEIMICTARAGDTLTVSRGQEGTAAQNWLVNDIIGERWTAAQCAAMLQQGQAQSQSTNYALDTGAANAYQCTLSLPISSPVPGMPIRVKIANTNTGASTFNPGSGAGTVTRRDGSGLIGGEIIAGVITEFMWNGTSYNIMNGPGAASAGVVAGLSDTDSFITPANAIQLVQFSFGTTGYMYLPGSPGVRPIFEWTQTVINTGTSGSFSFPVAMTGGLLWALVTPNFNVSPGDGAYGTFGGGPSGITIVNQMGQNGNFMVCCFGRF